MTNAADQNQISCNPRSAPAATAPDPIVIYFHHVGRLKEAHYTSLSVGQFERALDLIGQAGDIVSLLGSDPLADPSRPRFALTFDDGYEDTLVATRPILDRRAVPATHFVITNRAGRRLEAPWGSPTSFAGFDILRDAASVGDVIASHTHTHRRLGSLSKAEARNEVATADAILKRELGDRHVSGLLAYPYGETRTDLNAVRWGFATSSVPARPWLEGTAAIRRVYLDANDDRGWQETIHNWVRMWRGVT
jgi:peptidoglycan/xylan/chitin deacetylase (PgdA/CDA1 family)